MGTAWLIGSYEGMADASITVDGVARTFTGGDYYLIHSLSALNLLNAFTAALDGWGVSNATYTITRAGKVVIEWDGSHSVAWGSSGLGTKLGFTATINATSNEAPLFSPIFWSPGSNAEFLTPFGTEGFTIEGTVMSTSPNGRRKRFANFDGGDRKVIQDLSWDYVPMDRAWSTGEAAGEFFTFREIVLAPGSRFMFYNDIDELRGSSDDVSINTSTALGPYTVRDLKHLENWYRPFAPHQELGSSIVIQCERREEY